MVKIELTEDEATHLIQALATSSGIMTQLAALTDTKDLPSFARTQDRLVVKLGSAVAESRKADSEAVHGYDRFGKVFD